MPTPVTLDEHDTAFGVGAAWRFPDGALVWFAPATGTLGREHWLCSCSPALRPCAHITTCQSLREAA